MRFCLADIANECFEKSRKGRALLPLNSMGGFQILYSHGSKTAPRKSVVSSPYRKEMVSRAAVITERRQASSPSAGVRRSTTVTSPSKEPLTQVAPSLDVNDVNVTQVAAKASPAQYSMNKQPSSLNSKAAATVRVRNTPTATPTIVTPGHGLPVPQRSVTFAQLKGGAGAPSNAAGSLKVTVSGSSSTRVLRPPTRQLLGSQSQGSSKSSSSSGGGGSKEQTVAASIKTDHSTVLTRATVMPKQSAGLPGSAASSSVRGSARASLAESTVDATPARRSAGPSSDPPARRSAGPTSDPPVDATPARRSAGPTSDPPHHHSIKSELRHRMTASEAILIRNITKQNLSIARKSNDKPRGGAHSKGGSGSLPEHRHHASKTSRGVTTTPRTSARQKSAVVTMSDNTKEQTNSRQLDESDDLSEDDDVNDDGVSIDSCHDEQDVTTDVEASEAGAEQQTPTDNKRSVDAAQQQQPDPPPPAEPATRVSAELKQPKAAATADVSKKITLHLSPHGSRGSRDGGKPGAITVRYAAMYPTSPYIDTGPQKVTALNSSTTIAQLRMTHNGVLLKPKRVSDVAEHDKPNRGS